MRNMGNVATSRDPNWPSAATLLSDRPIEGRRNVGLIGISTYATSVTARSSRSTPAAIRAALERYSTWSFSEALDIAESVGSWISVTSIPPTPRVAPSAWRRPCRDGTRASRYG